MGYAMIEMMCHVHHIFFSRNDVISLKLRTLIIVYLNTHFS